MQAADKILFEVGKQDQSAEEFSLYPNQYESFLAHHGGEKAYYVGYATEHKHWSYVLPGPLDGWAGGGYWAGYHPRHFPSLFFQLDKVASAGDCRLSCYFAGVNEKYPTRIRVEINGQRMQPVLVEMNQFDTARELTFQVEGCPAVTRKVEAGESIQEVLMPAATSDSQSEPLKFTVMAGKGTVYQGTVNRSRQPLHGYADDVDLLMGTGNSRWMFKPSPSLPLGMVQIAPDNQDEIWKAGYEYTIENIMGFNHFSDWTMTGFLMQPTCGELQVNPGREDYPDEGYRSRIDKRSERAEIGRYSVFMTDTKIQAEITATRRAALQRYRFPARKDARILIDLFTPNEYPHNLVSAKVRKVSDTEIEGEATYYNAFTGYSLEQSYTLHFVLQFSKPFESMGGWVNEGVKPVTGYIPGWNRNHQFETEAEIRHDIASLEGHGDMGVFLNYTTHADEEILVRSGVSLVDIEGARKNLQEELVNPFGRPTKD